MTDTDTNNKRCFAPPTKLVLHQKLEAVLTQMHSEGRLDNETLPSLEKMILSFRLRGPNVAFYLKLMSIFAPEDEIF